MSEEKTTVASSLAWLVLMWSLAALSLWWQAYVLLKLWEWHVIDAFAVSPLSMSAAAGVMLIGAHVTHQLPLARKTTRGEDMARAVARPVIALFVLGLGWAVEMLS